MLDDLSKWTSVVYRLHTQYLVGGNQPCSFFLAKGNPKIYGCEVVARLHNVYLTEN